MRGKLTNGPGLTAAVLGVRLGRAAVAKHAFRADQGTSRFNGYCKTFVAKINIFQTIFDIIAIFPC